MNEMVIVFTGVMIASIIAIWGSCIAGALEDIKNELKKLKIRRRK